MNPGGVSIPLGREHPWRRTIAATAFVLGTLFGAVAAWLTILLTGDL